MSTAGRRPERCTQLQTAGLENKVGPYDFRVAETADRIEQNEMSRKMANFELIFEKQGHIINQIPIAVWTSVCDY